MTRETPAVGGISLALWESGAFGAYSALIWETATFGGGKRKKLKKLGRLGPPIFGAAIKK